MPITSLEDVRTTGTRGLGAAKELGWYPGSPEGQENGTITRDFLYCSPFTTGTNTATATELCMRFNGSVNSARIVLGIYDARSDGFPRTNLYDSGTITASSTTHRTIVAVPSHTLASNTLYYLACLVSSTSALGAVPDPQPSHFGWTADVNYQQGHTVMTSYGVGALPGTFPTASPSVHVGGPLFGVIFR